ncbi:MAG TPA: hypothetical protein VHJ83_13655 [Micromonosporaceae bacterium]|nr:hypothetical protein [Micromonosporaceae bacterium]
MTSTDNKPAAQRVLEEIFPANDTDALRDMVSDQFVNHEAPAARPGPGWDHDVHAPAQPGVQRPAVGDPRRARRATRS